MTTVQKNKNNVTYIQIDADRDGQRIDNFLLNVLKGVPKQHIYRILRRGEVRVNSKRIKPFYRLQTADSVRIPPIHIATIQSSTVPNEIDHDWLESRILYEDQALLALNKPAGIPVHGGTGQQCGVIEALRVIRQQDRFLELVHRLDLETSGCLLIAKKRSALRGLHDQFRSSQVKKIYQALLAGQVQQDEQVIDAPIRVDRTQTGARKVTVSDLGKQALTGIRCLHTGAGFTHVECQLFSGRTHQIRVHCQSIGHPIIGDQRYGNAVVNRKAMQQGLKRQFLHASCLTFKHPVSQESMSVECVLDSDLQSFLDRVL
ncbi:MAG: RluA family pseudouridine synthase [Gammaproteobacteria bacterium]|nr:RluA family pseudouridine synthase [Gammaproteobacteria bacterium]